MNKKKFITTDNHPSSNSPLQDRIAHQSGAVLIISLIMLLLLTIIGTTAMQTTSLEEKMAGNLRDRNIAFQAAESALRDAEQDINIARAITGFTGFTAGCAAGLCYNGTGGYSPDIWVAHPEYLSDAPGVTYGQYTNAPPLPDLSAPPRYIIEGLSISGSQYFYRITARAQGANPNTVVWLQEIFRK